MRHAQQGLLPETPRDTHISHSNDETFAEWLLGYQGLWLAMICGGVVWIGGLSWWSCWASLGLWSMSALTISAVMNIESRLVVQTQRVSLSIGASEPWAAPCGARRGCECYPLPLLSIFSVMMTWLQWQRRTRRTLKAPILDELDNPGALVPDASQPSLPSLAQMPLITASSPSNTELYLPNEFMTEMSLVMIAPWASQQKAVRTWLPFARKLERVFPSVCYYELLTRETLQSKKSIEHDAKTRKGSAATWMKERVLRLSLDHATLYQRLELQTEHKDPYVLLIARDGRVIWRATGALSQGKSDALKSFHYQYLGEGS